MVTTEIRYRALEEIADLEQLVQLEKEIWGLDPHDAVPSKLMRVFNLCGGVAIGAFYGDCLVGLCVGFPARRQQKWVLWSHMTGVRSDVRAQGIGLGLKLMQRTWALEHGYETICWTFDPLQRINAHFNLCCLGAVANIYHVNFYGEMTDQINAGLPSDRLEVTWSLRDKRVSALASGRQPFGAASYSPGDFLLTVGLQGQPQIGAVFVRGKSGYCVEIPFDLAGLKRSNPQLAYQWRIALREILGTALANGQTVVNFMTADDRCWYALSAHKSWYVYVVQCGDGSLYTGIAVDVEQRVRRHNKGQGAAYTATRLPVSLVATWRFATHSEALRAEHLFKRLSRQSKLNYIGEKRRLENAPFVG